MPRGRAEPKNTSTNFISIDTAIDLVECGEEMLSHGYAYLVSGHINPPPLMDGKLSADEPGTIERGIQLSRPATAKYPSMSQVSAQLGQVLILDDAGETITAVLSADEFSERYKT